MPVRDALQAELEIAMRRRDRAVADAVRSTLAALANAEAVTGAGPGARPAGHAAGSTHVAGATAGLGATEAPRMELSEQDQRAIVASEAAALTAHAERLARLCRRDEADGVRRAAQTLARAVDDVPDLGADRS